MLPQKFSAATTWIVLPEPPPLPVAAVSPACEEEAEQAVAVRAVRATIALTSTALADGRTEREAGTVGIRELLADEVGRGWTRVGRLATSRP
jgi:hypothetical protein